MSNEIHKNDCKFPPNFTGLAALLYKIPDGTRPVSSLMVFRHNFKKHSIQDA